MLIIFLDSLEFFRQSCTSNAFSWNWISLAHLLISEELDTAVPQGRVTVIVLTCNSVSKLGSFFDEVLQSVFEQDYPSLEVIVVDNGSSDGTPDYVEKHHGNKCGVLRLGRNYGWSGGNNRGALLARGADYLFFMNDDVLLERSCVRKLVDVLSRHRDLAAVQPLIENRDGTLNSGLDLGLSGLPMMRHHLREYPLSEAFYVSGAALLTRTEVFFRAGMSDDDLFLYHDDADYSWRLRLMGYKVACVASTRAYHWGSASLGSESPLYFRFLIRNCLWVMAKNSSLMWILPRVSFMLIEIAVSFLGHMFLIKEEHYILLCALIEVLDSQHARSYKEC